MTANPAFIKLMNNRVKFRMFLLSKIPSAYFSGIAIQSMTEKKCVVSVPYKWFSQNPFRSTYFACLAMAGEMSTGSLAMAYVYKRKPSISMLVVKMEAYYYKKADAVTYFTCEDGEQFAAAIAATANTGEAVTFSARSTGVNKNGEKVAEFIITWSFKRKAQS